jgi:hypothetical protein
MPLCICFPQLYTFCVSAFELSVASEDADLLSRCTALLVDSCRCYASSGKENEIGIICSKV